MTPLDGTVLGTTTLVDNGSPALRWNQVILGDGYQIDQMPQYQSDARRLCEALFATPPFDDLQSGINMFRVDVTSTDSGADDPVECGGTGTTAATYFDAAFCADDLPRKLVVNATTALSVANAQVPQWHSVMVIVNAIKYGGSGGAVGVFSLAPNAEEIAIHEMGHSAFQLADEYEYLRGCGEDTDRDHHPPLEPTRSNVTTNSNRATLKWRHHVADTTPIPTTQNNDCTKCDPQPNPLPAGTVGLYEGADTYHCGAYRPEFDCKMRNLGIPFCAVCRERIRRVLFPYVPTVVPHVQERRPTVAVQAVTAAHLTPQLTGPTGPNAWVWRQSPNGGTVVNQGSTVVLQLKSGPIP